MSTTISGPDGELVAAGPPRTLRATLWATALWCALTVLSNVLLWGQKSYERKQLIDLNNKSKHKKVPYGGTVLENDVHTALLRGLIVSVLVSVILMLLAALTWRGRPWARWVLLALALFGVPFGVGVFAQLVLGTTVSLPGPYKATVILAGFAAMVVVVMLLHRLTREYFKALRDTQRGTLPAVPGARTARPAGGGLGALFAPRRRPAPPASSDAAGAMSGSDTASSDTASSDTAPSDTAPSNTAFEPSSGGGASRRAKPTRPGSVKPKSTGRPGRSKSRQQ